MKVPSEAKCQLLLPFLGESEPFCFDTMLVFWDTRFFIHLIEQCTEGANGAGGQVSITSFVGPFWQRLLVCLGPLLSRTVLSFLAAFQPNPSSPYYNRISSLLQPSPTKAQLIFTALWQCSTLYHGLAIEM